jgi:flagellar protein FliS
MTNSNAYLRTRVMSASPAELRLMLFDGAIRFLSQGLEGLETPDYEAAYDGYSKCQAIIVELLNALDPSQAPELCERLGALYSFMYTHLVDSLTEKDVAKGREVLSLLEYERETWRQVMEKLAAEGMELKVPAPNAAAPTIDPADTAAHVAGDGRPVTPAPPANAAPPVRRAAPGGYGASSGGSSLSVRG